MILRYSSFVSDLARRCTRPPFLSCPGIVLEFENDAGVKSDRTIDLLHLTSASNAELETDVIMEAHQTWLIPKRRKAVFHLISDLIKHLGDEMTTAHAHLALARARAAASAAAAAATAAPSSSASATLSLLDLPASTPLPAYACHAALSAHALPVTALAANRLGDLLATASADWSAKLWSAGSGTLIARLEGHRNAVTSVDFCSTSSDRDRVLTGSLDGACGLWTSAGKLIDWLRGHEAAVTSARFSPVTAGQAALIASASVDGSVRLWDSATARQVGLPLIHDGEVTSLDWVADGSLLLTASADRTCRVWDVRTGTVARHLRGHVLGAAKALFHFSGALVLSAGRDSTARLWSLESGRCVATLAHHADEVRDLAWSACGDRFATVGADGDVAMAHTASATAGPVFAVRAHEGAATSVGFNSRGTMLLTAGEDGAARLWCAQEGTPLQSLRGHAGPVSAARWSYEGDRVYTAGEDCTCRVWTAAGGRSGPGAAAGGASGQAFLVSAPSTPSGGQAPSGGGSGLVVGALSACSSATACATAVTCPYDDAAGLCGPDAAVGLRGPKLVAAAVAAAACAGFVPPATVAALAGAGLLQADSQHTHATAIGALHVGSTPALAQAPQQQQQQQQQPQQQLQQQQHQLRPHAPPGVGPAARAPRPVPGGSARLSANSAASGGGFSAA